jgi:hypothetical protein
MPWEGTKFFAVDDSIKPGAEQWVLIVTPAARSNGIRETVRPCAAGSTGQHDHLCPSSSRKACVARPVDGDVHERVGPVTGGRGVVRRVVWRSGRA